MKDVIIIGAGPAGLTCAIEAAQNKLDYVVLDRGCIANSIYNFPANIIFFSTPDLLEIGKTAFISNQFRPNRQEVLNYYLKVVKLYNLNINTYEEAVGLDVHNNCYTVHVNTVSGKQKKYQSRNVILATGYYDNPNMIGIKGEDLPKVSHYYTEAHPYYMKDVAVIGGNNSAVEAALELHHYGAKVTLIHRNKNLGKKIKYWVLPDIKKRIENKQIKAIFNAAVQEISKEYILLRENGKIRRIKNDFVFAMTGYRPDSILMDAFGIQYSPKTFVPKHKPKNLETNLKGVYVAGSIISGINNNRVFIENSREHGKKIFR
jgi:thioredoxin reductase (NADPH)